MVAQNTGSAGVSQPKPLINPAPTAQVAPTSDIQFKLATESMKSNVNVEAELPKHFEQLTIKTSFSPEKSANRVVSPPQAYHSHKTSPAKMPPLKPSPAEMEMPPLSLAGSPHATHNGYCTQEDVYDDMPLLEPAGTDMPPLEAVGGEDLVGIFVGNFPFNMSDVRPYFVCVNLQKSLPMNHTLVSSIKVPQVSFYIADTCVFVYLYPPQRS